MKELFEKLVKEGLNKLGSKEEKKKEAEARIKYESGIIEENNEYEYYLILRDIVEFARKNGILLGPGRDAVPGSMICYVLGITKIDPIEYGLLSERFSSVEKYEGSLVEQRIKSVKRYSSKDICIDIGNEGQIKLSEFIKKNKEYSLEEEVESQEVDKGNKKEKITIKVGLGDKEKKINLLAVGVLDLITEVIEEIKIKLGKVIEFEKIPLDDKNIFEMIGRGEIEGVFQLKGERVKNLCMKIRPKSIEDLSNIIALNGPGKEKIIDKYLQGEEKKEETINIFQSIRGDFRDSFIKILEETNGVILYQEQIMKIFHVIAGFSLDVTYDFIKMIREKNEKFIKYMEGLFRFKVHRLLGIELETVNNIWQMIISATPNAFIKAHTIAYATLAYKVAYLKYYFPEIFNNINGERLKEKNI